MILDFIHSLSKFLPEIKSPETPPGTKERLMWTGIALVLFFMMYETTCVGVQSKAGSVDFLQTITASKIGTLLTAGIGPIVLASIFLQLFVGAGLLKLNIKEKADKQKFLETQKVLAILLAVAEGVIFVITGRTLINPLFPGESIISLAGGLQTVHAPLTMALVVFQIAMGSVIVLFLDEIVSKYGIGSGISLFIAAGVSLTVAIGLFQIIVGTNGILAIMSAGSATAITDSILALLPFGFTVLVFLAVAFAESVKVEIPIAFERVRGMVPKLPLKYFYVSNIPVIFASALIINLQLFSGSLLVGQYWNLTSQTPTIDFTTGSGYGYDMSKDGVLPLIGYVNNQGQLEDGLLYLFTPIYGSTRTSQQQWTLLTSQVTPLFKIPEWVHAIFYALGLSSVAVLFGMFWVEIANMDAKSVAGQLSSSGLQIPGFRRDPRMLETILNKHIYPLTILGSFSVGLLAAAADLTGALGTGTGILLTVGILHRMYEQLEQMDAFEAYPALGKLVGE
jgi:preprotein translocase subunit SecY